MAKCSECYGTYGGRCQDSDFTVFDNDYSVYCKSGYHFDDNKWKCISDD